MINPDREIKVLEREIGGLRRERRWIERGHLEDGAIGVVSNDRTVLPSYSETNAF